MYPAFLLSQYLLGTTAIGGDDMISLRLVIAIGPVSIVLVLP